MVPLKSQANEKSKEPQFKRADQVLRNLIPEFSRNRIQRDIKNGLVTLNGNPIKVTDSLQPGDELLYKVEEPEPSPLSPISMNLEFVYEDKELVVVNKPRGLVVHPSESYSGPTLVHGLLAQVKDLSGLGGVKRPGIVHRLDKDTSGLILIAKNDETHQHLSNQLQDRKIEKTYIGLAYGTPKWNQITKESQIGRNPKDRKRMISFSKGGRKAISHFRVKERYYSQTREILPVASLLEVQIETGRTHQIRVHATELNHSLLGDPVYGTPSPRQRKWNSLPKELRQWLDSHSGQLLHASKLQFIHPRTGQILNLSAPFPNDFTEALEILKNHARLGED